MPSRPDRPRLCLYGDCHIASFAKAVEAGHRVGERYAVDTWGAPGKHFRRIDYRDGAFVCRDDETRALVRLTSRGGPDSLEVAPYDAVVFTGARIALHLFANALLHLRCSPDHAVSAAVVRLMVERFFRLNRSIVAAQAIAAAGLARVYIVPTPFLGIGSDDTLRPEAIMDEYPGALLAGPDDRAWMWGLLQDKAAEVGVTLLAQPDETVTHGAFTEARWQRDETDLIHMNADFAGLMLDRLMDAERRVEDAAAA